MTKQDEPVPSGKQDEIREQVNAGNMLFPPAARLLLSLLDAERKRVQELQEHEDAEAKFMAKRGVLYDCTFIDGWAKVLDERDELKVRVQELEEGLLRIRDCAQGEYEDATTKAELERGMLAIKAEAESLLSKEQMK